MGKRGPPAGEGGAPRKVIDLTVVRRAASIGCTNEEIAVMAGLGLATIQRRLADDPEFQRVIAEGREAGRATLRRLQWEQAHAGNPTMLIWLGKQLLGQRDRHEIEGKDGAPLFPTLAVTFAMTPTETDALTIDASANDVSDDPSRAH